MAENELQSQVNEKVAIHEDFDSNIKKMQDQYEQLKNDFLLSLENNDKLLGEKAELQKLLKESCEKLEILKKNLKDSE